MVANPAGFQPVYGKDFGIITGYARETISGGEFVFSSGVVSLVGSVPSTFNPVTDVLFATGASGNQVTGIATNNAGSNEPVAVATRGFILVPCEENIVAGNRVDVATVNAVRITDNAAASIGRAVTEGSSGAFLLVNFDFT